MYLHGSGNRARPVYGVLGETLKDPTARCVLRRWTTRLVSSDRRQKTGIVSIVEETSDR